MRAPTSTPFAEGRLRPAALALALSAAAGAVISFGRPDLEPVLIAGMGALLVVPLLVRAARGTFDPFEPIFIFALAYGVMFVVRPAAMLVNDDFVYSIAGQSVSVRETFQETLLLGALGAAGFVIGYHLPVARRWASRLRPPPASLDHARLAGTVAVFAGVGLLLFLTFLTLAGGLLNGLELLLRGRSYTLTTVLKETPKYLLFGPLLILPSVLVFYALARARRDARFLVAALLTGGLLVLLLGPQGNRTVLLPLVAGILVFTYVLRDRRPGAITLVAVGMCALVGSTVLLDARQAEGTSGEREGASLREIVAEPQQVFDPITRGQDAGEAPAMAAALTAVPEEIGWKYGTGVFGDLLTRPIPRAVWSGKPLSPREEVIQTVWTRPYLYGVANPEFTVAFAFYLDWGPLGVLMGLLLYGVGARVLYEWFRANRHLFVAQLLFSASVPFLVTATRDSPVDTFAGAAFVLLPLGIAITLATRPSTGAVVGRLRRDRTAGPGARPPLPAGR